MANFVEKIVSALGQRLDGWANPVTGVGMKRDRATQASFYSGTILDWNALAYMYAFEHFSAKIVDVYPREEMRLGFQLGDLDPDEVKAANTYLSPYSLEATVLDARIWARLFGGCMIWVITDDGLDVSEPMGEYNNVLALRVIDRRFVVPDFAEVDLLGESTHYFVVPIAGQRVNPNGTLPNGMAAGRIHRSRLVRFNGARTDTLMRKRNAGWDLSVLQRPYDALRADGTVWGGIETLVTEASQTIYKIKGLFGMISGGQADRVLERLSIMDQTRSVSRAVVLDSEGEDFDRKTIQFAGLNDIGISVAKRVASAAEIPVTVLMGEAPAGLNATGDADLRWFLARVVADRMWSCEPPLKDLLTKLLLARRSPLYAKVKSGTYTVSLQWQKLWSPTETEAATMRASQAQADAVYIDRGVLTPQEVALSRFTARGWSGETHIDTAVHEQALEADKELLAAGDVKPPAPPVKPGQQPPQPPQPPPQPLQPPPSKGGK